MCKTAVVFEQSTLIAKDSLPGARNKKSTEQTEVFRQQLGEVWTFHEQIISVLHVSIAPKDITAWWHNKKN